MKKTIVITAALMLLAAAIITGTFASFSKTLSAEVALQSFNYDASAKGTSSGDNTIAPGQTKTGTFLVSNTGSGRLRVSEIVVTSSDENLTVTTPAAQQYIEPGKNYEYTFTATLGENVNVNANYTIRISVTVVDDLGNTETMGFNADFQ